MRIQEGTLEGKTCSIGYKVVTEDLRSLGLRRNPHIITFPIGEWIVLPPTQVVEGKGDYGGIWAAIDIGNARHLQKYMRQKRRTETRVFKAFVKDILYANSYRLKTSGIYLDREVA